ncbi:MAG: RNA methyltransferase [Deltaproteobacteria bacterium]|jgi:tRNA G18 (ribose-2'-O)-methylase SpoU|nr:RNA methyltransferase [Deltaproteobacteria bacterium]
MRKPLEPFAIGSPRNPRYKNWLKLLDGRGIKKQEQAILAGRRFIEEILEQFPERALALLAPVSARPPFPKGLEALAERLPPRAAVYALPPELFASLDIYGIKEPLLLVSAPAPPDWNRELEDGLTVFLPFQNPINLGTCIRSAAAFGARVVLLEEAATPYLPKCLRASGPSIFQAPPSRGPSLRELAELAAGKNLPLYGLSPRGGNIYKTAFPRRLGLVAGLEGPGLDDCWPAERRLSIPMQGRVESLNAAVSMSIGMALYCAAHSIYGPALCSTRGLK